MIKQTCMFDDQQTSLTPNYFQRLRGLLYTCMYMYLHDSRLILFNAHLNAGNFINIIPYLYYLQILIHVLFLCVTCII